MLDDIKKGELPTPHKGDNGASLAQSLSSIAAVAIMFGSLLAIGIKR